jgi:hypothetical protein
VTDKENDPLGVQADWAAWPARDDFVAEVGDETLAFRIFLLEGENAPGWLDECVPALGGRKPRNCLKSKRGRQKLRSLASRFPR